MSERVADPEYGRGTVELAPDEIPPSAGELLASLNATFASPKYQPPVLPRAATELLAIANDREVSVARIVELIETDPVLAARVVSRANSAAFSRGQPVRSLRDAVGRLGLTQLRDVVLEQAMNMRVFRARGYQPLMEQLSAHATATAEIARLICRYASIDGELAFLAGLLHDIGVAGILIALAERPRGEQPHPLVLDYALAQVHEQAAERMARLWSLPPELVLVVRHHHQLMIGPHVHPLCAVVTIAEAEATARGAALGDLEPPRPQLVARAMTALDLDERKMKLVRADLDRLRGGAATAPVRATPARNPSVGR